MNKIIDIMQDKIEWFKSLSNKYKIIIPAVLLLIIIGSMFVYGLSGNKNNKTASDSDAMSTLADAAEESVDIVAMSPDGAQFPSLNVELPTEAPAPEYLRNGVRHSIVAELQQKLMNLGFMDNDDPTDYFGAVTEAAVKTYQRQNKLTQDGIVGPETLASIMSPDAKYYAAENGDVGDDILHIQQRLYQLGYIASSELVTGTYGDQTEAAVKKLQEVNGLNQDGKAGRQTINLIYSEDVKANMLAYGEKSDVVMASQKRLFELGYMTSIPDGTYGEDTSTAVKAFQSRNDLVVDGYLGPGTREVLMASSARANGLVLGDQTDMVTKVQNILAKLGYLSSKNTTGYFGEATEAAVEAFQSRNGISSDGSVGAQTMAKLTSSDVKGPAPNAAASTKKDTSKSSTSKNTSGSNSSTSSGGSPSYTGSGGVGTLLSVASSKLGSSYVWGSKGPSTFDCSGFVYWCLNNSGVRQSYITSSGWQSVGKYTRISSFSSLQAGDIIVVSGHVGICAGGGQVIDASSSNGKVVRRSLGSWWQSNFIVGWRIF